MAREQAMTRPDARHRRGSAYILVLGTAMIVTTIGMSSLLLMRVHTHVANASRDEVKARFFGPSVADLATFRIASNAAWRTAYTNDAWTNEQTVGELKFRYKLIDEADGDLGDDGYQRARLYAKATVGSAVRIYSVMLEPDVDGGGALTGSVTPVPGTWRQEVLP